MILLPTEATVYKYAGSKRIIEVDDDIKLTCDCTMLDRLVARNIVSTANISAREIECYDITANNITTTCITAHNINTININAHDINVSGQIKNHGYINLVGTLNHIGIDAMPKQAQIKHRKVQATIKKKQCIELPVIVYTRKCGVKIPTASSVMIDLDQFEACNRHIWRRDGEHPVANFNYAKLLLHHLIIGHGKGKSRLIFKDGNTSNFMKDNLAYIPYHEYKKLENQKTITQEHL